ncbi:MAG: alpha/beta hydrolase [bacterium]|nr:alpha/beta hydrolase [bacterium]
MGLNRQAAAALALLVDSGMQMHPAMSIKEMRRIAAMRQGDPGPEVAKVEDFTVAGPSGVKIPVRIYRPVGFDEPTPPVVYFHGGGWVVGSLDSHDAQARRLANYSGCTLISVDYRLAPEHPFPAAYDDAMAVTRWICRSAEHVGVKPGPVGLCGDSSGGNLAAAAAITARDEGLPVGVQVLIYPVLDNRPDLYPSYREFGEGYFLTFRGMKWYLDQYIPAEARDDWRAAPMRAGNLSGLAPAMILSVEVDVLRDEAEDYARRLRTYGVPTSLVRYKGMFHGAFGLTHSITAARDMHLDAAAMLRDVLVGDI